MNIPSLDKEHQEHNQSPRNGTRIPNKNVHTSPAKMLRPTSPENILTIKRLTLFL